jgi:hypothetical protein
MVWAWILIAFLVLLPLAFAWRNRGWGLPTPPRFRRPAQVGPPGITEKQASWAWVSGYLWFVLIVLVIALAVALLYLI